MCACVCVCVCGRLKYTYVLTYSLNSALTPAIVLTSIIQTITLKRNKLDIILSKINSFDKHILRNSSSDTYRRTSNMAFVAVSFMFVCICDFISDCRKNIVIRMTHHSSHVIRIITDIQYVTFSPLLTYQFVVLNKQLLSLFGVRSERKLEQNILGSICQASTDYFRFFF